MTRARSLDEFLRSHPGYTLSSLLAEDAHELLGLRELTDEHLGEARG